LLVIPVVEIPVAREMIIALLWRLIFYFIASVPVIIITPAAVTVWTIIVLRLPVSYIVTLILDDITIPVAVNINVIIAAIAIIYPVSRIWFPFVIIICTSFRSSDDPVIFIRRIHVMRRRTAITLIFVYRYFFLINFLFIYFLFIDLWPVNINCIITGNFCRTWPCSIAYP